MQSNQPHRVKGRDRHFNSVLLSMRTSVTTLLDLYKSIGLTSSSSFITHFIKKKKKTHRPSLDIIDRLMATAEIY